MIRSPLASPLGGERFRCETHSNKAMKAIYGKALAGKSADFDREDHGQIHEGGPSDRCERTAFLGNGSAIKDGECDIQAVCISQINHKRRRHMNRGRPKVNREHVRLCEV
jgi:hypothetical protein